MNSYEHLILYILKCITLCKILAASWLKIGNFVQVSKTCNQFFLHRPGKYYTGGLLRTFVNTGRPDRTSQRINSKKIVSYLLHIFLIQYPKGYFCRNFDNSEVNKCCRQLPTNPLRPLNLSNSRWASIMTRTPNPGYVIHYKKK